MAADREVARAEPDRSGRWPGDLTAQPLRLQQHNGLLRQGTGTRRRPIRQVAINHDLRIGSNLLRKGAAKQIDVVALEWLEIENPLCTPAVRKGTNLVLRKEGPDIEVLDSIPAIDVMEGRSLAKGDAENTFPVRRPVRLALEAVFAILGGDLGKAI